MERREFLKSALASASIASQAAPGIRALGQQATGVQHEYYQWRTYTLRNGPQLPLIQNYFEKALIPALNRLGMSPIGTFKLDIGPETPCYYALIPANSANAIAELDMKLASDSEYTKAASGFRDALATAPAFIRAERTLLYSFNSWPKVVVPKPEKRIFQFRTYESPSQVAHMRKVQMFNEAEINIFKRAGLNPVFFGSTVIGTRMPSLSYMLTFKNVAELGERWAAFASDPEWKDISKRPGNTDPEIVSNISNLYLSPLSSSQI